MVHRMPTMSLTMFHTPYPHSSAHTIPNQRFVQINIGCEYQSLSHRLQSLSMNVCHEWPLSMPHAWQENLSNPCHFPNYLLLEMVSRPKGRLLRLLRRRGQRFGALKKPGPRSHSLKCRPVPTNWNSTSSHQPSGKLKPTEPTLIMTKSRLMETRH